MATEKRYGLKLKDDFGASDVPHSVPPLPGFFQTSIPTPVGGDGELPLEAARNALKAPQLVDADGFLVDARGDYVDEKGEPAKDGVVGDKTYAAGYYGMGDVLELVTIKSGDVEDAKQAAADALHDARNGLRDARQEQRALPLTEDEEVRQNEDVAAATTGGN